MKNIVFCRYVKYLSKFVYYVDIDYELGERKEIAIKSVLDDAPPILYSSDEENVCPAVENEGSDEELAAVNANVNVLENYEKSAVQEENLLNFHDDVCEPPPPAEFSNAAPPAPPGFDDSDNALNPLLHELALLPSTADTDRAPSPSLPPPVMFGDKGADFSGVHDLLGDVSVAQKIPDITNFIGSTSLLDAKDIKLADDIDDDDIK